MLLESLFHQVVRIELRQLEILSTLLVSKSRIPDQSEILDNLSKDGVNLQKSKSFRDLTNNSGHLQQVIELLENGKT